MFPCIYSEMAVTLLTVTIHKCTAIIKSFDSIKCTYNLAKHENNARTGE